MGEGGVLEISTVVNKVGGIVQYSPNSDDRAA